MINIKTKKPMQCGKPQGYYTPKYNTQGSERILIFNFIE